MTFKELNLTEPLVKALATKGYETPTPIQQKAIPVILEGKDIFGCAQTGTGKTAAFALPILQLLDARNASAKHGIKALILAPTRELVIQIADNFKAYGANSRLRHVAVFGGVGLQPQINAVKRGVDIVIATPGRLLDLMSRGAVKLNEIEIFVLDEADRMLDMGFIVDIKKIIAKLPAKRHTLFFSATAPKEIMGLANSILRNPVRVSVDEVSSAAVVVNQSVYHVKKDQKRSLLNHILKTNPIERALVFTRTKRGADKVVKDLNQVGIKAEAIHGNKSQSNRERALARFKSSDIRVLVATDIASRGIDVTKLSHVINFEIPEVAETYVHRIGRTGRAGESGVALSFCTPDEMVYWKDIQKLVKKAIPVTAHPFV